jgi:hypothetical protein
MASHHVESVAAVGAMRQRRLARVTGTPERSARLDKVAELVQLGRRTGVTRAELVRLIESAQ